MSMLDNLLNMLPENVNLQSVSEKLGLSVDELQNGGSALFERIKGGEDVTSAVSSVAGETGIDAEKLKGLVPEMAQQFGAGGEEGFLSQLTSGDGMLGKLGGMLDRDGDGNPINDLTNMAKGLFSRE
jgi:hypothetical protein